MLNRVFGFFSADLAIDLGTANTLISVPGEGLVLNEPSVVAVGSHLRRVVSGGCAVGHLARQMWGRTPDSISVVRPLKDGVITDFQLCEAMLRYFLRKVQRNRWSPRPRVLIGVPGSITPVEKRAVFNSAERAGAREVLLIAEAKAAAIGVGLPIAEPLASMIVDIGGGTSEIAVLSVGDIVSSRSLRMGGDHMDQAVADYLRRRYGLRIGLAAAEQLRIAIGSAYPLEEELVEEVAGADAASGLPRRLMISSEELREVARRAARSDRGCDPANGRWLQSRLGGRSDPSWVGALRRRCAVAGTRSLRRRANGHPRRVAPDALGAVAKGILTCLEHLDIWRGALESSDDDV